VPWACRECLVWAAMKRRGREIEKKSIVVIAAEKNGRGIGRIRMKHIKDVSAESLLGFIRETVVPGATIHTDGWRGYSGLPAAGYKHFVTTISEGVKQAHEVSCRASITSLRCSSDGCLVRFRVGFNNSISIITSTNSRFASTAAVPGLADYYFTASRNRP